MVTVHSLARDHALIASMFGKKDRITDYATNQIFTYICFRNDYTKYENKRARIVQGG